MTTQHKVVICDTRGQRLAAIPFTAPINRTWVEEAKATAFAWLRDNHTSGAADHHFGNGVLTVWINR